MNAITRESLQHVTTLFLEPPVRGEQIELATQTVARAQFTRSGGIIGKVGMSNADVDARMVVVPARGDLKFNDNDTYDSIQVAGCTEFGGAVQTPVSEGEARRQALVGGFATLLDTELADPKYRPRFTWSS